MSAVPPTENRLRRMSGIWLPDEPGEEELARYWTLSEADRREISQCRGDENRRRFGAQLCVLRNYGRLLESGESVPIRIGNHLGAQLQLTPVLFAIGAARPATETEYIDRIRRYLGYRSFDSKLQRELAAWAEQRTLEGLALAEVALRAEELLRRWLVVLPRVAVFERLLQALCRRAERQVFTRIEEQLPPSFLGEIDALLDVPESERRSSLFRLKEYPPEGKPETILAFLDNYTLLQSIGVSSIRIAGCSVALFLQFARCARREDVWHLRRLPASKRHAMVACFLIEALKTTLDQVIEMNDQFLLGMCRRSKNSFERKQQEYRQRARDGRQQYCAAWRLWSTAISGPSGCIVISMSRSPSWNCVQRWQRDAEGCEQNPRRLSPSSAAGSGLGHGTPLVLRRAALCGTSKLAARVLLSALLRLLRSSNRYLYTHLRPDEHLLQPGDIVPEP
jgi:hypothetical protein